MEESTAISQVSNNSSDNIAEESGITLNELLRAVRAKWLWYVISIGVCVLLAALYLLRATPMYTRSSEILLKDDSSQSVSGDLSMLGVNTVPSELLNEMFIMSSPEIMEHVVETLQLNSVYRTPEGLRKAVLYRTSPVLVEFKDSVGDAHASCSFKIEINGDKTGATLSKFTLNGKKVKSDEVVTRFGAVVNTPVGPLTITPTKYIDKPAVEGGDIPLEIYYSYVPVKVAARTYSTSLQSEYAEDRGNVITLTISCPSPVMAADVLNAIVDAYNMRWVTDRNKIAAATSKFIDERLVSIEDELGDVESNITDYKSAHRMMDMDAMAQLYLAQSSENQRALNQLAQEIAIGRYIKSELSKQDITRLLPSTAEIGGTSIQQMVTEYNKMVSERNLKLETLPEDSPALRQKTQAIERSREAILASVDAALASLNKRYNAITLVDNRTQNQLATAPGQAKYLMSEERKQKVKESLYLFLLQRREENELSQAFAVYNTRMVTEPYGPVAPTSPNTRLVILLAVLVGILIPTLIIYIKEITNTKVRSRKDIEDLQIPFLGEVPLAEVPQHPRFPIPGKAKKPIPDAREILIRPHCGNVINEAFRMIRTNIDFMGAMKRGDGLGKTIMIVSMNAGSGKTFVSLNTAAIFALKGKRTCLVDFDLRKGTASQSINNPRKGVVDFLIGKTRDLNELIVSNVNGIENFDMLPEGVIPPNPTELLYSPNLDLLITRLRETYDYVFFDCPPIEIVADARLLNPFIDMTIFVMRSGLFDKADINVLRAIYNERRYNNLALVLNATDEVHGLYGYYGYGYGYGYGYYKHQHRGRKKK